MTAIGKRLSQVRDQISDARIKPLLDTLAEFQRSHVKLVAKLGMADPISPDECTAGMVEVFQKLGVPYMSLDALYQEIAFQDSGSAVMEMHEGGSLSDEGFLQRPHRPMPPKERGQRLARAVITCRDALSSFEPGFGLLGPIIQKIGQRCLDEILEELSRLSILRLCEYCHMPLFPAKLEKRFCSREYESSNCSAKQRSRRSYQRKHASRRQKKRPQGKNSD